MLQRDSGQTRAKVNGNTDGFRPTTDLHYHMDAMSPRAIFEVSRRHGLPWSGRGLREITQSATVDYGASWEEWYPLHSAARAAVFVRPEVFKEVAWQAALDAELEGLDTRVMRYSLSMPQYCFRAMLGRKPDLNDSNDAKTFIELFQEITWQLHTGLKTHGGRIQTPLVFSFSCQDDFLPIMDRISDAVLDMKGMIRGLDLTNEQLHRLPTHYKDMVTRMIEGGLAFTVHAGEKEIEDGTQTDEKERRLYSAKERIRAALELCPDTLGHAIYAVRYLDVIEELAKAGVVVELCPSINLDGDYIKRGLEGDERNYPLLAFKDAGIPVTINTDIPGLYRGMTLRSEFRKVQRIFGLDEAALRKLDETAKDAAVRIYGMRPI